MLQEIEKNEFLLILLEEKKYQQKLEDIIRSVKKSKTTICYVCLSKPYKDVIDGLKDMGINPDNFFFIDVLTSHYKEPSPTRNCVFLSSPNNLESIKAAIIMAIEDKNCSVIIFDTISTLLIYEQSFSVVRFTHNLVSEKKQENVKKLFIIIKGGNIPSNDIDSLTKDLEMFADKKVDLTNNR